MERDALRKFCERWLAAWTGNRPDELVEFYAADCYYRDPAVKDGLRGRESLLPYITKLLEANPEWRWEAEEIFPTDRGFTLKWKASIPVKDGVLVEYGLDIVEITDGRIVRNEVYFDRTALLAALKGKS